MKILAINEVLRDGAGSATAKGATIGRLVSYAIARRDVETALARGDVLATRLALAAFCAVFGWSATGKWLMFITR